MVAEVDYFTQSILAPFEQYIKSQIIKGNNEKFKAAYDQQGSFERAKSFTNATGCARSSDLQSATDNLQVSFQSILVEQIMLKATGIKGMGKIWKDIVSERDFKIAGLDYTYRYGKGQPMGTKCS